MLKLSTFTVFFGLVFGVTSLSRPLAFAYAPTEPCDFLFKDKSVELDIGPGFIIEHKPGEYMQGIGFHRPAPRQEWVKNAENKYEAKIVEQPVRMVRKKFMTSPEMFYLRDKDGTIISHFNSKQELNHYVCDVLYRNYGRPKK